MITRKVYATGSATGNNVAQVIVPSRSRLVMVQWAVKFDSITDNASCVLELSLAAATEVAVNQAQQCISEIAYFSDFVTSGLVNGAVNLVVPTDVILTQGQIIYLHAGLIAGTLTYTGGANLWLAPTSSKREI